MLIWQSSAIPKFAIGKFKLKSDILDNFPPSKAVKETVFTPIFFADLIASIRFGLFPETENRNKTSFFLHNLSIWNEKILS